MNTIEGAAELFGQLLVCGFNDLRIVLADHTHHIRQRVKGQILR